MALPGISGSGDANLPQIDEELTYSVLTSQARRRLLVALVVDGPQTGVDLKHAGRGYGKCTGHRVFTQSTLANLKKMVQAGIVLQYDHPSDGRRVLYGLSPTVKVAKEGDDTVFDFGFIVARLSADGN